MKDKKKNLLVTLADENYIDQAKQLFSSVYWNAGWKGDYMLLSHKIPEEKLKWFKDKGILIKNCDFIFKIKKRRLKRWPDSVFSKFCLFTSEFKKWKKIIYLDSDIIVRASLDDLTRVEGFAAVGSAYKLSNLFLNPLFLKVKDECRKSYLRLKNSYNLDVQSFNSGVFSFDTSIIKKDTYYKMVKLFEDYAEIGATGEGSILNLWFHSCWEKLSNIYNSDPFYQVKFYGINPGKIKGIVLHFHERKPWNPGDYFYEEWKNNLRRAELIDLKKYQSVIKKWTEKDIQDYLNYLRKRKYKNYFRYIFWKTYLDSRDFIAEYRGLLGMFFESGFPRLCFKLKKLRSRLRAVQRW